MEPMLISCNKVCINRRLVEIFSMKYDTQVEIFVWSKFSFRLNVFAFKKAPDCSPKLHILLRLNRFTLLFSLHKKLFSPFSEGTIQMFTFLRRPPTFLGSKFCRFNCGAMLARTDIELRILLARQAILVQTRALN